MSTSSDPFPDETERDPGRRDEARQDLDRQDAGDASEPRTDSPPPPYPQPRTLLDANEDAGRGIPAEPGSPPPKIPAAGQSLFARFEYFPTQTPPRIPHLGHLVVFALLGFWGLRLSVLVVLAALHYHLFGVSTPKQAEEEIHYTLGSQAAWYLITLLFCVWIFPLLWRRGFFAGLNWHAAAVMRYRWRLIGAALACFVVALVDEVLLPGPANAPIDQTFRMPGAAWLLFAFGVTLAPLSEEIAFRGFLLPALCSAHDWIVEQLTGAPAPQPLENGHPRWSLPAMAVASVLTSIPFALMHGYQTAYSVGPFLLLFCISLVLCWVRLATRSLAASIVVHSTYNLLLFALMFLGTGGFHHLDNM